MALIDPDFLSAATSAVSGLVGAFIGAWAAKTQHRSEYHFRKRNALRAIMIEMTHNQMGMCLDLDRALPAYIARIHNTGHAGVESVKKALEQARPYSTTVYDALFSEALGSEFGSELMSYYDRIAWLNARTPPNGELEIELSFGRYMLQLANAMLVADDLVPVLDRETRKSKIKQWGRNQDVTNFMESRNDCLFVAHITKFKLDTLEEFVTTDKPPPGFPAILANNKDRVESYIYAAKRA